MTSFLPILFLVIILILGSVYSQVHHVMNHNSAMADDSNLLESDITLTISSKTSTKTSTKISTEITESSGSKSSSSTQSSKISSLESSNVSENDSFASQESTYTLIVERSLNRNGLHGKLNTVVTIVCPTQVEDSSCVFPEYLVFADQFSKHTYLDRFELSEIERILQNIELMYFEEDGMDVEKPSYRMKSDHIVVMGLRLNQFKISSDSANSRKSWTFEYTIPVHFRYQEPFVNRSHVEVPLPKSPIASLVLFSRSDPQIKSKNSFKKLPHISEIDDENEISLEWTKNIRSSYEILTPKVKIVGNDNLVAQIPVGKIEDQSIVSPVTLLVSTLGAILLTVATFVYASRND